MTTEIGLAGIPLDLQDLEHQISGNVQNPAWLTRLRQDGLRVVREQGIPTRQHEEWKYTDVSGFGKFSSQESSSELSGSVKHPLSEIAGYGVVTVNGHYRSDLAQPTGLPAGAVVCSLAEAISKFANLVSEHLGRYARNCQNPFTALNSASFVDGVFIYVPANCIIEDPINILHYVSSGAGPSRFFARTLVVAERSSSVSVTETFAGSHEEYAQVAVTEFFAAENANVDHVRSQVAPTTAWHIGIQQTEQERSSRFASQNICFGSLLNRNDIGVRLGGEGIESTINGLYICDGRQHIDNHTAIDHAMPHCNSFELYKGVMAGRSTGVFNGKIFVRQDAQKTDSKQTNQNLLLSDDAQIDTKPQLEIYADDVRCTHGATVGHLDNEAIFYLQSRGIARAEAQSLLVNAFASDVLGHVKAEDLREKLEAELHDRLTAAQG